MYNALVLERLANPGTMGIGDFLDEADAVGQEGIEGEGPYMRIALQVQQNDAQTIVCVARFETYGCPAAIACGSWLTQWVQGKSIEQAGSIEPGDLSLMLGGLPLGKEHCAQLAVKSLRSALAQIAE